MGKKTSLNLCWDEEVKKPIVIQYRNEDKEVLDRNVVEIETVIKVLKYYIENNNMNEVVIDGIRVIKE